MITRVYISNPVEITEICNCQFYFNLHEYYLVSNIIKDVLNHILDIFNYIAPAETIIM